MLSRGRDGWNWKTLIRRFGPAGAWVIVDVLDATAGRGAFGPEYALLDFEELSTIHHLGVRQLQNIVNKLIRGGVFLRYPGTDWTVKVDIARLREAPVRAPVVKTRKPPETATEIHFREKPAALVYLGASPPGAVAEMHFRNGENDIRPPETYCQWNWRCPYLSSDLPQDKTFKTEKNSLSSSSEDPATTTEGANAPAPDAAPAGPPEPEPRIDEPAPDRRDTARASVRPSDRTERKRAVPRPPQPAANNGGGRRDRRPGASDPSAQNEQNITVLCDPVHCPPVVADAVAETTGAADQEILDRIWRDCSRAAPGITSAEVVQLVRRNARKVRQNADRSVHGLLRTVLVNDASSAGVLLEVRRIIAEDERRREEERNSIRELYADPDTSEELKRNLRAAYDFLDR